MTIPYIPTPTSGLVRLSKNDFVVAALIAVVLSGATFALAYGLGWLSGAPNWFEVAGATINYGATYLSIKQRRFTYVLGFTASAAFAIAYYQYGLLASALLSGYLVGQLIYGYFRWGPDAAARPVHKFQWKWAWAYALATVLTYFGAVGIVTLFGGRFAFWDAAILILTILAQFLLDNKVIASWYVWGVVNIVGVSLYITAGAPFAAMQQFIFLFANIPGFILWKRSMDAKPVYVPNPEFDPRWLDHQIPEGLAVVDEVELKHITGTSDLKHFAAHHSADTFKFEPGDKLYIATGQKPIISDKPE